MACTCDNLACESRTFDGQPDHFTVANDCPFCCTHLSNFTLNIARNMAAGTECPGH